MKEQVKELIDRLADKRPGMGCWIKVVDRRGQPIVRVAGVLGTTKQQNGRDGYCIFIENPKNGELEPLSYKDFEILGHDILIGRVLRFASIAWTEEQQKDQWLRIVELWFECGIEKSLQQIALEDTKESQALFQFLLQLGL